MANQNIPVNEKYMLSINEAAQYFNIGVKKMRRLAEDNLGVFAVYSGNRYSLSAVSLKNSCKKRPQYKYCYSAKSS